MKEAKKQRSKNFFDFAVKHSASSAMRPGRESGDLQNGRSVNQRNLRTFVKAGTKGPLIALIMGRVF
jgi:hypothetical protein